ncbi:GerMN domain-containing protein [Olavius algarvensis spirochete endosymbiont]|uniref:GerMN domain-containing protein n=1 Tax=Olavius algarvensis spirochete endosymbiont TaxID=260710 RepID=UPI000F519E26|nr:GerMN domain-containing protein [Olavius algarvensis spirochete endosymbiont]
MERHLRWHSRFRELLRKQGDYILTDKTRRFKSIILTASFFISFILSVIAYRLFRPPYEGRVFYYPVNTGAKIKSELRVIPIRENVEEQLAVFLEELLLGPASLELTKTLAKGTAINNVAIVEKIAYVDFSRQILNTEKELPISYDEAFDNIRHNIEFNFSRIEKVVFTIEGRQVNKSLYVIQADADY